jgi:hypothetical protein
MVSATVDLKSWPLCGARRGAPTPSIGSGWARVAGLETKEVSWTMQSIVVLVAIFVLSFVAGFGWYTGGAAARVIAKTLKRDSPRQPAKERAEAQPSRVKGHEADEPAV